MDRLFSKTKMSLSYSAEAKNVADDRREEHFFVQRLSLSDKPSFHSTETLKTIKDELCKFSILNLSSLSWSAFPPFTLPSFIAFIVSLYLHCST